MSKAYYFFRSIKLNSALSFLSIVSLFFLIQGCGSQSTKSNVKTFPLEMEMKPIHPLQNTENLTENLIYQGQISDCLSGFSQVIDHTQDAFFLQDSDRNCKLKLTSFSLNGEDFPLTGDEDWAEGSTFDIVGNGNTLLTFTISKQIESPISRAQNVVIWFGSPNVIADQTVKPDIEGSKNVTGAYHLNFDIHQLDSEVSADDGFGIFSFILECDTPVENMEGTLTCHGVELHSIRAKVNRNHHENRLNLNECRDLTQNGDSSGNGFSADERPEFPNGGLEFTGLMGPGKLHGEENSNLMFGVEEQKPNGGCLYFSLQVE